MQRDILHLHVPAFSVAVARLTDASLRGWPVAIAVPGGRGPVLSVSSEAREAGVRKGMLSLWAMRVCPELRVVPPPIEAVEQAQHALFEIARQYTPLWEPSRPGHLFLDVSGSGRLLGPLRDAASRIDCDVAQRLGFRGSVGAGGNKLVSRVASLFLGQGGVCDVLRGTEAEFLSPLPLDLLPGLGSKRRNMLQDWGVEHIGELRDVPLNHLQAIFGVFGRTLRSRAEGEDWDPVQPPLRSPEVRESETLAQDSANDEWLLGRLLRLAERACMRLRAAGRVAGRVEVCVRYADGKDARKSELLSVPTYWEHEIQPLVRTLFLKTVQRRMRVRWLGVVLSRLAVASLQLDLFRALQRNVRRESLGRALDSIRARYGFDAVGWGLHKNGTDDAK